MVGIERSAPAAQTARGEQGQAAQRRMANGARWVASFRHDLSQEPQVALRREDVARSAVFFDSTCCWV